MSERILRRREVEARVGLARSTIYEMVFRGDFPAPIKLGARAVGWVEAEVAQWLEGRKASPHLGGIRNHGQHSSPGGERDQTP